jgi:hypothetical protein
MPASFFVKLFPVHAQIGVSSVPGVLNAKIAHVSNSFGTMPEGTPVRTRGVPRVPAAAKPAGACASLLPATDAERRQDEYEERAAILEYDGNYSRAEAERMARAVLCMTNFGAA